MGLGLDTRDRRPLTPKTRHPLPSSSRELPDAQGHFSASTSTTERGCWLLQPRKFAEESPNVSSPPVQELSSSPGAP